MKDDSIKKDRKRGGKSRKNKFRLNQKHINLVQRLTNFQSNAKFIDMSKSVLKSPEKMLEVSQEMIPKVSINKGMNNSMFSKKKMVSWRMSPNPNESGYKTESNMKSFLVINLPRETVNNFVRIFIENLENRPANNYQPGYYKEDFLHVDSSDIESESVLRDLRFFVDTRKYHSKDVKKLQKFVMFVLYVVVEFRLDYLSGKKSAPLLSWVNRVFYQNERKKPIFVNYMDHFFNSKEFGITLVNIIDMVIWFGYLGVEILSEFVS